MTALVWFRSDLRTDDNTALYNALTRHEQVVACYFLTPEQWTAHDKGPRALQWIWQNLMSLRSELAEHGIPLYVLNSSSYMSIDEELGRLIAEHQVSDIYSNIEYGVDELDRDTRIQQRLGQSGVEWHAYHDYTLMPPGSVLTQNGAPFKVFTPFKRAWIAQLKGETIPCLAMPKRPSVAPITPPPLPEWRPPAAEIDVNWWPAGEHAAKERLLTFTEHTLSRYQELRDIPAIDGTSRLSPYLTLGVISVRRCFEAALAFNNGEWSSGNSGATTWLSELIWREFYQHVLSAFNHISKHRAFKPETDALKWRASSQEYQAWCDGRTGYPLVDAAMKQLNQTGWMHNRMRMVTAMFLSKYLMLDWRLGERYFMEQLLDGELGANNGGWQWSASTGTDAAPYFRVLSPIRQAERFDPDGAFTTHYLPELAGVSKKSLVSPGCPELLARGYSAPIVDLKVGRDRVIDAFKSLDKSGG